MPLRESVYPKHIAVPWVLKSRAWLAPGGIQPANHNHVKTKMPLESRFINLEYYSESLCSSLMSFKSLVSRSCGSTSSGARRPRGSHRLPSIGSGASPVAGWRPNAWSSTPAAPLGWTSWPGWGRSSKDHVFGSKFRKNRKSRFWRVSGILTKRWHIHDYPSLFCCFH